MRIVYCLMAVLLSPLLLPGTAHASVGEARGVEVATYTVVDGDWLSSIAARRCGSTARWPDIYNLNRAVIGSNPNLIRAGQRLLLPAGCSGATSTQSVVRPASGWVSPLSSYRATTCFEWRKALYVNGKLISKEGLHSGLDLAIGGGTPIRAVAAGTVIRAGWRGGYGYAVEISHGGDITSMYAHQSRILVSYHQRVVAGQTVGRVGSTGSSTGNHLHLGVYRNGSPINPASYLATKGVFIRGCQ